MNEQVYRANPAWELVLFDRLASEERVRLRELAEDPDFYGVLRPRAGEDGTWKAVDRDTALLLLTLRRPGPPPAYARRTGPRFERELAALVLDGVLELAADGGRFVSGPQALPLVGRASRVGDAGGGALGALSRAALRYGAALELDDPRRLSLRLYDYHRVPLSPRWSRLFPDAATTGRRLGLDEDRLPPGWSLRPPKRVGEASGDVAPAGAAGWLVLVRNGPDHGITTAAPRPEDATYKLYFSPRPEELRAAVDALLAALPSCPTRQLKLGADAAGLLRPDKIVIYFTRFADLAIAGVRLADALTGLPAHGVPFSAEIAGDGLLSWGVDPPADLALPAWGGRESWRLWLTDRLALALLAARREPSDLPPWRFALERLALEGVDVERWMPSPALWRPETES